MAAEKMKTNLVSDNYIMPEGICTLWKQGLFVDYTVRVKSRKFKVHKIVLTSMSDYFRVLLTGSMAESQTDCIEVKGVSASVMDKLICFMYTNDIKLTKNTAADVLAGAMYLQIPTAVRRCTEFMVSHLSSTNWFDVLSLFKTYNLLDAIQNVKAFMKQELSNIAQGISDFGELLHDDVSFIVENWQSTEFNLVLFITKWVEADPRLRKKHLKDLLNHVQYCLISPNELTSIKSMKIDRSCRSDLQELVKKGLAYHELPMYQKVVYNSQLSEIRGKLSLLCFAMSENGAGSYFEMTAGIGPVADQALKMPEGVLYVDEETVINNFFVICATVHIEGDVQQWFIFDLLTKQWSEMANLERLFHGGFMANDGKYLYAIGGLLAFPATEATSTSIDRYDFHTNTWSSFAELRFTGSGHSACILDNKLYISGGRMNNQPEQATMDCLDLSMQTWEMKPPMFEALCNHTMHVMMVEEEKVICIFNDSFFLEYYSPRADKWYASSFTFSKPVPRKDEVGMLCSEGNTVYLVDINLQEAFGEVGMAYQQLQLPENGDDIEVTVMKKYQTAVINPTKVHSTLLRRPFSEHVDL